MMHVAPQVGTMRHITKELATHRTELPFIYAKHPPLKIHLININLVNRHSNPMQKMRITGFSKITSTTYNLQNNNKKSVQQKKL